MVRLTFSFSVRVVFLLSCGILAFLYLFWMIIVRTRFLEHVALNQLTSVERHIERRISLSGFVAVARDQEKCTPKTNIMFLKTHKTGGTTLANMFYRFGNIKNLTFALPRPNLESFYWPSLFTSSSVDQVTRREKPNILASHARYNCEAMKEFMPDDTVSVTVLRDPVTQFISVFNYMKIPHFLELSQFSNPLEYFLDHAHDLTNLSVSILNDGVFLLRNSMSFDLGLDPKHFDNLSEIKNFVKKIEKNFDLVLLTEKYAESVILLKKLLCWELRDVLFLKHNVQIYKQKTHISDELKEKIRHWNNADVILYSHFKERFLRSMNTDFVKEANYLRMENGFWIERCVENTNCRALHSNQLVRCLGLKQKVERKYLQTCEYLVRSEGEWLRRLLLKQFV